MLYQKSHKRSEMFLTYEEVGAIARATQEQIEKWFADGLLHIVKLQGEPNNFNPHANAYNLG